VISFILYARGLPKRLHRNTAQKAGEQKAVSQKAAAQKEVAQKAAQKAAAQKVAAQTGTSSLRRQYLQFF
jgi:hypothetical protein